MRARAIVDILTRPRGGRIPLFAEGLALITEHVAALTASISALQSTDAARGVEPLQGIAAEEAGKALILLDFVRMDSRDQRAARNHLTKFNQHLARGIYAQAVDMSPGSMRELRKYVDLLRRQLYLDGPNDVDWVFRNEVLQAREEAQYVDYVAYEDAHRWVSPRERGQLMGWRHGHAHAPSLVAALSRLGAFSEAGLGVVSDTWEGVTTSDSTSWMDHASLLRQAATALVDRGLHSPALSDEDVALVLDRWTFPMGDLDLSEVRVSQEELEAERAAWEARMAGEWL